MEVGMPDAERPTLRTLTDDECSDGFGCGV